MTEYEIVDEPPIMRAGRAPWLVDFYEHLLANPGKWFVAPKLLAQANASRATQWLKARQCEATQRRDPAVPQPYNVRLYARAR